MVDRMMDGGMMWGMGLIGLLLLIVLVLGAAALIKYLFFDAECKHMKWMLIVLVFGSHPMETGLLHSSLDDCGKSGNDLALGMGASSRGVAEGISGTARNGRLYCQANPYGDVHSPCRAQPLTRLLWKFAPGRPRFEG
jgi:hypothetical protein